MKLYNIFIAIIIFLFANGCSKRKPIEVYTLNGTYKIKKVIFSAVDNYQNIDNQYYVNGLLFVNPQEVKGLDSIVTDFSCVKIEEDKVHFNQLVTGLDTVWKNTYFASDAENIYRTNPYYYFYPKGSKRIWKIIDKTDSVLTIDASTQWPLGNVGAGYSTILLLKKL